MTRLDSANVPEIAALLFAVLLCMLAVRRDLNCPFAGATVALGTGIGFSVAGFLWLGLPTLAAAALAVLGAACALIAEIDRRHRLIPDLLTAAVVLIGVAAPFAPAISEQITAAVLLGGIFCAIRWFFSMAGKPDALGLGDAKLAGAIGMVMGARDGLFTVAIASAGTAFVAVLVHLLRGSRGEPPPAPFGIGLATVLFLMSLVRA
jgi:leader peptidase (prepilin peptidase)/N-methyltransferase